MGGFWGGVATTFPWWTGRAVISKVELKKKTEVEMVPGDKEKNSKLLCAANSTLFFKKERKTQSFFFPERQATVFFHAPQPFVRFKFFCVCLQKSSDSSTLKSPLARRLPLFAAAYLSSRNSALTPFQALRARVTPLI